MAWLLANWTSLGVAVLGLAEILSLFIKGNGTLKGIITAIRGIPGVKDPGIGQ